MLRRRSAPNTKVILLCLRLYGKSTEIPKQNWANCETPETPAKRQLKKTDGCAAKNRKKVHRCTTNEQTGVLCRYVIFSHTIIVSFVQN